MVFHLTGSPLSTCTRRVAMVLHEKGVPFVFHPVDIGKGEHKTPEFIAKQPFGQVPYIEDEGLLLFESRAIAHYIATKYADQGTPGLVPTETKANALFQQAASIEFSNFNPYAEKAVVENVFKPMRGLKPNKELADELIATLIVKLDIYEKILSKQKYLAGDSFTLADLYHIPYGSLLPMAGAPVLEVESRPNVARWWKDISSRPAWIAVKDGVKGTA